jgi:hypothetical protein
MTRPSCRRFRSNQVRVALSLLAHNLRNLWRRLGLPRGTENENWHKPKAGYSRGAIHRFSSRLAHLPPSYLAPCLGEGVRAAMCEPRLRG